MTQGVSLMIDEASLNVSLQITTEVWRVNAEQSSIRIGEFLIVGFWDLPGNWWYCIGSLYIALHLVADFGECSMSDMNRVSVASAS